MNSPQIDIVILREPKDLAQSWHFNPGTDPWPLDQYDRRIDVPCNHNWPIQGLTMKLKFLP